MSVAKPQIAVIATVPFVVDAFFRRHLLAMAELYSVTLMTSEERLEILDDLRSAIEIIVLPIKREIDVFADVGCLLTLLSVLRKRHFVLIQSFTPKAGLMGMLAGRLMAIRCRIHMFTGQVWVTRSGIARAGLKFIDKVIARSATSVLIDSRSQRQFLIDEGVVEADKSEVLGEGSISGVDTARFRPDAARRQTVRDELNIAASDIVVLFLGRVARDKGVLDLAQAFLAVHEQCGHAVLVVAGPEENEMVPRMREILHPCIGAVRFIPYTRFPEHFMAASDIFCLPSYREGFGNAVIEAGACEVPSIASNVYGLRDAVVDGETGVLVPPADPDSLSKEILRMALDDVMRKKLGVRARERSMSSFEATKVTRAMMDYYQNLIT